VSEIETIEQYLDELADRLVVSPRRARRILVETQDHLYATRERLISEGMTPEDAESTTLREFGSPALVARGFRDAGAWLRLPFLEAVATPLIGLAAIGFVAISLSGLLALGLGVVAGKQFVAGDPSGVTYTPERCSQYLRLYPDARDCTEAALADHFDEVFGFRLVAGVLAVVAVGVYLAERRLRNPARMPQAFAPTIGAAAFGLVGIALTGLAASQALAGENGAGANLSAGLVALVFAAAFSLRLLPLLKPQVAAD
jgi:hypothetical protein